MKKHFYAKLKKNLCLCHLRILALKALSTVMNENGRNEVFSVIKQLQMREYSKDTYFSLNYYVHVIIISTCPESLTSCFLNVVNKLLT